MVVDIAYLLYSMKLYHRVIYVRGWEIIFLRNNINISQFFVRSEVRHWLSPFFGVFIGEAHIHFHVTITLTYSPRVNYLTTKISYSRYVKIKNRSHWRAKIVLKQIKNKLRTQLSYYLRVYMFIGIICEHSSCILHEITTYLILSVDSNNVVLCKYINNAIKYIIINFHLSLVIDFINIFI